MAKGRILVVDDEQMVEQLYEIILATAGYEHVSFHDINQAMSFLVSNHAQIDLALVGITMLGVNAEELAKRMAQIDPGLPVIVVTAVNSEHVDGNVRAILHKPVLEEELLSAVQTHMRHHDDG